MGTPKRKRAADPKLIKLEADLAAAQDELDAYWARAWKTFKGCDRKRMKVVNLINRIRRHKLGLETPKNPSLFAPDAGQVPPEAAGP